MLDVDIAADVVPSLEAEEYLRHWEEQQLRQQERLSQLAAERASRELMEAAERAAREAVEAAAAAAAAAEREAGRERLAYMLPPEPEAYSSASELQIVTCAFALPDGMRISRRFTVDTAVQVLFDFVDSRGAGGWERGTYQLVTRMPRRVVGSEAAAGGRTLQEVGLTGGSEAFLLEALSAPSAGSTRIEVDSATKGMTAA